jgi:hypothetical protein
MAGDEPAQTFVCRYPVGSVSPFEKIVDVATGKPLLYSIVGEFVAIEA